MKSNSDIRPAAIQPLGNGSYYYNFNVVERVQEPEAATTEAPEGEEVNEAATEPRVTFDYDTVQVWGNPKYEDIVKAVIREEVDETKEFSYVNDYNAAKEGLIEDEEEAATAVTSYREYLAFVREVKAMVKSDLAAAGY